MSLRHWRRWFVGKGGPTYLAIDPARFIRDSVRAEPVAAQPFDRAQGEPDSWLIRAGSVNRSVVGWESVSPIHPGFAKMLCKPCNQSGVVVDALLAHGLRSLLE